MEYVTGFTNEQLEAMNPRSTACTEDFLADLEEQLDSGEITEDEAALRAGSSGCFTQRL